MKRLINAYKDTFDKGQTIDNIMFCTAITIVIFIFTYVKEGVL